jgi:cellobiose dehydrogenase (acceptor)
MSYQRHSWLLNILLLTWAATWLTNTAASSPTSHYIDVVTGITFYSLESPTGYLFGMMMPQHPTTDFIAQIVTPLADGAGWGGVSFGGSMVGPLLLVTW